MTAKIIFCDFVKEEIPPRGDGNLSYSLNCLEKRVKEEIPPRGDGNSQSLGVVVKQIG